MIRGVTEQSYLKTATWLNRIRHQEKATGSTTLRASVERAGKKLQAAFEHITTDILRREGCDETGQPLTPLPRWAQDAVVIPAAQVKEAIDACELAGDERAEVAQNPVVYEQPAESVNISIDDVVVKKQKLHRISPNAHGEFIDEVEQRGQKYVHNTVAHLQHKEHTYCMTGQGVPVVLRILLGYLLTTGVLSSRLQFFVDGQKTLHAAILRAFSWFSNFGLLLDWYHLEDTCKRQLSLAMKGRTQRNAAVKEVTRLLWYGRVKSAILFLRKLPKEDIKNSDEIHVLIGYVERNRPSIPCYEVRKR